MTWLETMQLQLHAPLYPLFWGSILTIFGLNGGWTSLFSILNQSIRRKKVWILTSSSPCGPHPNLLTGFFVKNYKQNDFIILWYGSTNCNYTCLGLVYFIFCCKNKLPLHKTVCGLIWLLTRTILIASEMVVYLSYFQWSCIDRYWCCKAVLRKVDCLGKNIKNIAEQTTLKGLGFFFIFLSNFQPKIDKYIM